MRTLPPSLIGALLMAVVAGSAMAQSGAKTAGAKTADTAELPNLRKELKTMSDGFAQRAPEEMRKKFAQGIADVKATGILKQALNVGDKAPSVELTAPDESAVEFSSLWAEQPVVVVFYRGGWCPYCNLQLKAMEKSLAALGDAGARLVAISPELPENAQRTVEKNDLSMVVLSDQGNQLAAKLGIAYRLPEAILPIYRDRIGLARYNGDDSYQLPLAAAYVIDTEGVIRYAFLKADYKKRAQPKAIVAAVKKLSE